MNEIEREDPHRELGYVPKSELGEVATVLKAISDSGKGPEDVRKMNMALLKELDPNLEDTGQSQVQMTIMGRHIDFHPSSGTYYSHAKRIFGYGIEKQVRIIQDFLKGKKNEPRS